MIVQLVRRVCRHSHEIPARSLEHPAGGEGSNFPEEFIAFYEKLSIRFSNEMILCFQHF